MLALIAVLATLSAPADSGYTAAILAARAEREARLRSDDGWLVVAGLYWLAPGANTFGTGRANDLILPAGSAPAHCGRFILAGDSVLVEIDPGVPATADGMPVTRFALRSDAEGKPDVLALNDLRCFVIKRTKGHAIRLRDLNAPARKEFHGLDHYPVDASWRITARFVPYDPPKPILIPSVVGTVDTMLAPGYVEFERDGATHRLDPVRESAADELFFIFKDATSGEETYPPGRFLYTDLPADGAVVLDFNRAVNPPCAYTAFATCPLPPPENALALAVTAGEKMVPGHR